MELGLTGKRELVTGASKGLGCATGERVHAADDAFRSWVASSADGGFLYRVDD